MLKIYQMLILLTCTIIVHSSPQTVVLDADSIYVSLDFSKTLGTPNNPDWPDECQYLNLCSLSMTGAYEQGLHSNEWIYSISPGRQCIVALWVSQQSLWPWYLECTAAFSHMRYRLMSGGKRAQGVKAGLNIDVFPSDPVITDWMESVLTAFPTEKTGAQVDWRSPSYLMIGLVAPCLNELECHIDIVSLPETNRTAQPDNID